MKFYDTEASCAAQGQYANEHDLPYFAPYNGICFKCGRQIYDVNGYSVEEASDNLITRCPHCDYSFVD